MRCLEHVQRGLRPWQATLYKINEIISWLQASRLIAGNGITLIETGDGIVVNAESQDGVSGNAASTPSVVLAKVRENIGNGYTADLYGNGLEQEPTERDVYVFLPEIAYGSVIAPDTVIMVNHVQTKIYNVNAEKVQT